MSHDPACEKLARYFLDGDADAYSESNVVALAEHIQDAIETWLDRLEPQECTCPTRQCWETGEPLRSGTDSWCPVHGVDPDRAYDEMRDRQMEDLT